MATTNYSELLARATSNTSVTRTYNYNPKYATKYTPKTKITNSDTNIEDQAFSVTKEKAGITDKMDKLMKFNLNMTYGSKESSYEKHTAQYFDRLYSVYPDKELDSLCQYVFIVRPDCNILKNDGKTLIKITNSQIKSGYYPNSSPHNDQFFRYMKKNYPYILKSLTSTLSDSHDFIPFLVGRTESLQLPDYTIKEYHMSQPCTNFDMPYASHALDSMTGGQFEISFRDDNEFRIHKLFQTWLYYINGVTRNTFGPRIFNIKHNKVDYATSVYYIVCKADAETIIYWSKYTGCFPVTSPNSNMSFNLRGSVDPKISIQFDYFHHEPLNPYIFVDFNKNAHVVTPNNQGYIPIYNSKTLKDIGMKDFRSNTQKRIDNLSEDLFVRYRFGAHVSLGSGNGLAGCPYIYKDAKTNEYKLRWKKIKDISNN